MNDIRSPILVSLGHVDHGKTTLLDKVRGTAVADMEPGAITQHISASYIPLDVIKKMCWGFLEKMKISLNIPGFLWIDSPGHEAFTTLRKRGGAIADLAVLVVDINEGFKPQTDESVNYLKQFKTPFIVAATKIDKITGWNIQKGICFIDSVSNQPERVVTELDEKLYRIVGQLAERGFSSERYDRIDDFTKQIAIIPVSGYTGEGVSDLLVMLGGIAEKFLKNRLGVKKGIGKGTILEVKEYKGLGMTLDVVLYEGTMKKGDHLLIGGRTQITTRIKALLKPKPLKELRSEKDFEAVDEVSAAAGIKISAPLLENVIAGSPIRSVSKDSDIASAFEEMKEEISEIEIETQKEGLVLKADTLGSLEALIKTLKDLNIPIRKAKVGHVTKHDIAEIRTLDDPIIFAFNVSIADDVKKYAKDNGVMIFSSNIIYRLIEDYDKWNKDKKNREEKSLLAGISRPASIKVLHGYVFRQSKPAVFGVEVMRGILKPGYRLFKDGKIVGEVKEIQLRGENAKEAKAGEKVALSMNDVVFGKDIKEGEEFVVFLTNHDKEVLEKLKHKLRGDEIELLKEMEE